MDQDIEDLFAFYAFGTLTESERSQVDAYVASNPEARSRLDEMIRVTAALPFEAAPVDPSPALKKSLMERVALDSRPQQAPLTRSRFPTRNLGSRLAYAFAVLCLLLALGMGIWGLSVRNEVAHLQAQVTLLEHKLEGQRSVLAQLTSPQALTYSISGTGQQPLAQGHLISDPKTGSSILIVSGLSPLAAGKSYEFWLIKDTTTVPAGLFKVDERGVGVLEVTHNLGSNSFNAIGVSIEPEAGSQHPTGDIVMLGKLP